MFLMSLLGACASSPQIASNPDDLPLVMEDFFSGVTHGDGMFVNSWTGAERRFAVAIAGTWDGEELILIEDFAYAD